MKTKLLALLLCFVLVASLFLMSACSFGKKKGSSETEAEATAAAVEVTDAQARQVALAAFLKGINAIRKGGITFTGTLKGTSIEKVDKDEYENENEAPAAEGTEADEFKTENFDLALTLKYNDEKFDAIASGTAGDDTGTFEAYFDGELFAILSAEGGEVYFLEDAAEMIPFGVGAMISAGEDGDYTAFVDQILTLIDFDKVAANVNDKAQGIFVIKTTGTTYTVTFSSDALFDVAAGIVNILKDSGDKPASALFDALLGEGSFAKLQETLEKFDGTDTLDTVLPEVEQVLTDLGIKVDALYEFIAPFFGVTATEEATAGAQMKAMATGMLSEMTINEAISMAEQKIGALFGGNKKQAEYVTVEPYQSAGPDAEPAAAAEEQNEEEGGLTYDAIVAMVLGYAEMNVNDLVASLIKKNDFDIATEVAPASGYIDALKEAIKATVSVTCDAQLNPTKIDLSLVIDTTNLPEEMQEEGELTQINLTINAEIKANVDITPSEGMQAQIATEKAARNAVPAPQEEGTPN